MISTAGTMNRDTSTMNTISAQHLMDLIKTTGKSAFIRQKTIQRFPPGENWKHRFVILANSALYVYDNEMSKKPRGCISLFGYNGVCRTESSKCLWCLSITPAVDSLKTKTFSCSTDEERKEWMRKIKEHLYKANDIQTPPFHAVLGFVHSSSDIDDDVEYLALEEPIYPREVKRKISTGDSKINHSDSESDEDDNIKGPDDDKKKDSIDSKRGDVTGMKIGNLDTNTIISTSSTNNATTPTPSSTLTSRRPSYPHSKALTPKRNLLPPRYSAVVDQGHTHHEYKDDKHIYANCLVCDEEDENDDGKDDSNKDNNNEDEIASGNVDNEYIVPLPTPRTLVKFCEMVDPAINRDRVKCNKMLMDSGQPGTYLVRKSRSGDYKVLAVLCEKDTVREYKIDEGANSLLSLSSVGLAREFVSLEALLQHYSHREVVPNLSIFLSLGIFDLVDPQMYDSLD